MLKHGFRPKNQRMVVAERDIRSSSGLFLSTSRATQSRSPRPTSRGVLEVSKEKTRQPLHQDSQVLPSWCLAFFLYRCRKLHFLLNCMRFL